MAAVGVAVSSCACTSVLSHRAEAVVSHGSTVGPSGAKLAASRRLAASRTNFTSSSRSSIIARAVQEDTSTDEITEKAEQLLKDAKARWDKVEDKTTVVIYVVGGIVVLTIANSILSAFESVPLFGKILEVVGLGYSTWFVYRYLLFTPSRQELYRKIDDLLSQITGETKEFSKEINEGASRVKQEAKDL